MRGKRERDRKDTQRRIAHVTALLVDSNDAGKHDLKSLEKIMLQKGDAAPNRSGRQEMIEHLINTYL
jgi:xylose isomerase